MVASPDQSLYTGLTLYDVNAYDLVQRAILDAGSKLPGWTPRVGSLEMVVLEALAIIVSEDVYALNRIPDAIMEALIGNFGIQRQLGSQAAATVTLSVVDTTGYSIPSGTTLRLDLGNGESVDFTTDDVVSVASGATTVVANITATTNTATPNGYAIGTQLVITSPVSYLTQAFLASVPSGGSGVETDDEWRSRAVGLFSRLTSVLALPKHFTARALEQPGVGRALTKDNWNVSSSAAGHVTVAVADDEGAALSGGDKTDLETLLDSECVSDLVVHVVDPDYNVIDVNVTVKALPNYISSDVQALVIQTLNLYLSPASWQWGLKVYLNEIISLVDQVLGVDRVVSVLLDVGGGTPTAADVTLVGSFPLTSAGTIACTVT